MLNRIPIILNLLTNRNFALIYSVTICEQKQRIVHGQEASNVNCRTFVFNFNICRLFNQSPLLTMVSELKFANNFQHEKSGV